MKIYMAAVYTWGLSRSILDKSFKDRKIWKKYLVDANHLESYHYVQNGLHMEAIKKCKKKVFMDSGAFSMFTQGVDVDMQAYADFLHKHKKQIEVASNLDHIGRDGEKQTWQNQKILEDMGATISPVHHARDKDKWLAKYLEAGYDYIFLGGMVPEHTNYLIKWLDRVWDTILTDKNGKPLVKVHGFGLTTELLMKRYPWYSVDSTSWVMSAALGNIMVPTSVGLKSLSVSSTSPNLKKRGGHYNTLTADEQTRVKKHLKKAGYKLKHLRDIPYYRGLHNIQMFVEMQNTYQWPTHFINPQKGLFNE